MQSTLEDIRQKLREGVCKNEEHVRLSLVSRILQELGWNIWNPEEVNTEFVVVPDEDNSKVDIALLLRSYLPSVFIEVKAVGKLQGAIKHIETQLRNYNRNNTAIFTVITDGQRWRFYYSLIDLCARKNVVVTPAEAEQFIKDYTAVKPIKDHIQEPKSVRVREPQPARADTE